MGIIERAVQLAKKNKILEYRIDAPERYNHYDPIAGGQSDHAGDVGRYDVEGHRSVDVLMPIKLCLYRPADILFYIRDLFNFFTVTASVFVDCLGLPLKDSVSNTYAFAKETFPTLSNKKWYWTVTINDMDTLKEWTADDMAEKFLKESDQQSLRYIEKLAELSQKIVTSITVKEAISHNYRDLIKIDNGIWALRSDIGMIFVDDARYAFDLKDGWSDERIGTILSDWALHMSGNSIKAYHKKEML